MRTHDIAYFGYGSLVNQETFRKDIRPIPTFAGGWIRQWKNCSETHFGKICTLTVERRDDCQIMGVMVLGRKNELSAMDQWEIGHECQKLGLTDPNVVDQVQEVEAYIYFAAERCKIWGNQEYPIFQSYLDCVLAGYLRWWGEAGVRHFIQTTEGWHVPILKDRKDPKYRRSFTIRASEQQFFDQLVGEAILKAKNPNS